jgi:hypothetical protein
MPKLTRDQQFQKSFQAFFGELTENFYPGLKEYNLTSTTTIKNRCQHSYTLTFPRKTIIGHIDTYIVDQEGIVTPPGPIMQNQDIPKIRDFKECFRDHFQDHALKSGNNFLSYTDIGEYWYQNGNDRITSEQITTEWFLSQQLLSFDLNFTIDVVYYKSHVPYPVQLSTKDQFENKCKQLESRNTELCINLKTVTAMYQEKEEQYHSLRRHMRIERRNMENKYKSMVDKMQKKFRELYSQIPTPDDCPVCYENIDPSKLKVPGCCHTICSDCAGRCTNCPICRENY